MKIKEPELTRTEIEQAQAALDRALDFFKDGTIGIVTTSVSGQHRGRALIEVRVKHMEPGKPHIETWGWAAPAIREYKQQRLAAWRTGGTAGCEEAEHAT